MKKIPLVTVILPSYNHGKHVAGCIEAFLSQTMQDFELVIIDDASTDDNLLRIKRFSDSRVKLIKRDHNHGVAAGMNDGLRAATASLVCIFATDDMPDADYLAEAIKTLENRPEAVAAYFPLRKITEDGLPLNDICILPWGAGRCEVLSNSFIGSNPLPSPGMIFRREVALKAILPVGVCQYSDWIFNNRLLMLGEITFGKSPLLSYRVSPSSLSAPSLASAARDILETRIMMDDFLKIQDMSFLRQVFAEKITPYSSLPNMHVPYILGRLALLSEIHEKRCWGYETIMRHISMPGMAESLREQSGFTHKDLMALVPTEAATRADEIRRLHRRLRHLRRWTVALGVFLALALWSLLR